MDLLSLTALQALLNLHGNVEVGIVASSLHWTVTLWKNERQAKFTGSIIIAVFLV